MDFRKLHEVEKKFLIRGLATLPYFHGEKESFWLVECARHDFLYKLNEGGTRKEAFYYAFFVAAEGDRTKTERALKVAYGMT